MTIKLILLALVLVAIVVLLFSIKMLFDKKAQFTYKSCSENKGECGCQASSDSVCKTNE